MSLTTNPNVPSLEIEHSAEHDSAAALFPLINIFNQSGRKLVGRIEDPEIIITNASDMVLKINEWKTNQNAKDTYSAHFVTENEPHVALCDAFMRGIGTDPAALKPLIDREVLGPITLATLSNNDGHVIRFYAEPIFAEFHFVNGQVEPYPNPYLMALNIRAVKLPEQEAKKVLYDKFISLLAKIQ